MTKKKRRTFFNLFKLTTKMSRMKLQLSLEKINESDSEVKSPTTSSLYSPVTKIIHDFNKSSLSNGSPEVSTGFKFGKFFLQNFN